MCYRSLLFGLGLASAVVLAGCGKSGDHAAKDKPAEQPSPASTGADHKAEGHGHNPGGHGGLVVDIGRGSYHAEFVLGKDGAIQVYLLGPDEVKVVEVEEQTLTAHVKKQNDGEAVPVTLKPHPQEGDSPGKTSRFTGTLPAELRGVPLEGTVTNIRIGGERYRFPFKTKEQAHEEVMLPKKVVNEEERKLYLTPGGKYTEEDIRANGNVTASEKFKGKMANHNLSAKAGDKICPITLTKANDKFSWVVGGQKYEFCCPPCIDEFVLQAKTQPELIGPPAKYVKNN